MHGFFVEPETEQNRFYLVFFQPAVFIGFQDAAGLLVHGRVREVQVLLQVAQRVFLGNVDGTAVEAFLPEYHLEQGGLAATVTAYEPYALMVAHEQARAIEQYLHAE